MAGIIATSATVQMGSSSAQNSVSGFIVGEQISLITTPTGTNYVWAETIPSASAPALSALDAIVGAPVKFTPDVGGMYAISVNVDGTVYSLVISVTDATVSTPFEALRIQQKPNASVPTPTAGALALFVSQETGLLSIKDDTDTVTTVQAS